MLGSLEGETLEEGCSLVSRWFLALKWSRGAPESRWWAQRCSLGVQEWLVACCCQALWASLVACCPGTCVPWTRGCLVWCMPTEQQPAEHLVLRLCACLLREHLHLVASLVHSLTLQCVGARGLQAGARGGRYAGRCPCIVGAGLLPSGKTYAGARAR